MASSTTNGSSSIMGGGSGSSTMPLPLKRRMIRPKMDLAKALSTMGFSTSRTLDPSGGHDTRSELNAALSRRMSEMEKRKRANQQKVVADRLRDEVRTLHEAYQFLSRKYLKHLRDPDEVQPDDSGDKQEYQTIREEDDEDDFYVEEDVEDVVDGLLLDLDSKVFVSDTKGGRQKSKDQGAATAASASTAGKSQRKNSGKVTVGRTQSTRVQSETKTKIVKRRGSIPG